MTLEIPTGYAQVALVLKHDLDPDPWMVTFGLDITGVDETSGSVPAKIIEAYTDSISTSMSNAVTLTEVRFTIGNTGGDPVIVVTPAGVPGTISGAMLPQNCAILVAKNSAVGGRKNRGRFYWPGMLLESGVNAVGAIDSALVVDYATVFSSFLLGVETASTVGGDLVPATPMVILHNDAVTDPTAVDSLSVRSTIATQRRRLR